MWKFFSMLVVLLSYTMSIGCDELPFEAKEDSKDDGEEALIIGQFSLRVENMAAALGATTMEARNDDGDVIEKFELTYNEKSRVEKLSTFKFDGNVKDSIVLKHDSTAVKTFHDESGFTKSVAVYSDEAQSTNVFNMSLTFDEGTSGSYEIREVYVGNDQQGNLTVSSKYDKFRRLTVKTTSSSQSEDVTEAYDYTHESPLSGWSFSEEIGGQKRRESSLNSETGAYKESLFLEEDTLGGEGVVLSKYFLVNKTFLFKSRTLDNGVYELQSSCVEGDAHKLGVTVDCEDVYTYHEGGRVFEDRKTYLLLERLFKFNTVNEVAFFPVLVRQNSLDKLNGDIVSRLERAQTYDDGVFIKDASYKFETMAIDELATVAHWEMKSIEEGGRVTRSEYTYFTEPKTTDRKLVTYSYQ